MTFRIGHSLQCQTIYHAKIPYQPKNYFSTMKNIRFTASPVLEVLDAPYCTRMRYSIYTLKTVPRAINLPSACISVHLSVCPSVLSVCLSILIRHVMFTMSKKSLFICIHATPNESIRWSAYRFTTSF